MTKQPGAQEIWNREIRDQSIVQCSEHNKAKLFSAEMAFKLEESILHNRKKIGTSFSLCKINTQVHTGHKVSNHILGNLKQNIPQQHNKSETLQSQVQATSLKIFAKSISSSFQQQNFHLFFASPNEQYGILVCRQEQVTSGMGSNRPSIPLGRISFRMSSCAGC
jgi:hypothetical protein